MSIRISTLALMPWLLAAALAVLAPPSPAQPVEGSDYKKLEPPLPTDSPGKIEVIEFFSYGCPHCNAFHPLISAWAAKLPKDVVFKRVPVSFNRPQWINLARAYYALQATGDLPAGDVMSAHHPVLIAALGVREPDLLLLKDLTKPSDDLPYIKRRK